MIDNPILAKPNNPLDDSPVVSLMMYQLTNILTGETIVRHVVTNHCQN